MESPFGSYIGTNYAPSAGELCQIFHFLKDPLDRLSSLDREIAHVAATLSHLQSERHVLQQFVAAHQALTHPIRRIPLEILLDIFAACLPTHRNPVMSTADAPLLLGRVCSSWRQISTTTPTLWSRLHIVEPGLPCQSLEAASVDHGTANDAESARSEFEARMRLRVDAVKLWLRRSGEAPLSLSLLCNTDLRSDGESAILEVLLAVRHRWERIELAGHLSMRQLQEDWGSDDVGQLQSLRLTIDRAPVSNRISQWGKLNLLRAPQLRELHVVGDTVWLFPLRLPLKWDELIELNLEVSVTANISSAVLQDILKLCPRLKTLRSWAWDGNPRLESGGIITHHALETLDLHYTRGLRLIIFRVH
ncbi:unnamed protein product [Mycena citricolor]|uniref:F-box domain-containing protein n=1 Tax=Mycena citricolor TaxID=2018698 RepID=A0AAD2HMN8_9AGAR|nr:unnamed protein product [Mycena citricolor]